VQKYYHHQKGTREVDPTQVRKQTGIHGSVPRKTTNCLSFCFVYYSLVSCLNVAMCRERFRTTSTRRTTLSSSGLQAMIAAYQKSSTRSEE
jgi:hypothetical protein